VLASLVILFLFAMTIPAARSSTPEQFNPAGTLIARMDPYSGVSMPTSTGAGYYALRTVFDQADHSLYTVQLGGVIIVFDTLTNRSLPEIILPSTTSGGDRVPTNALYDPLNGYLYVSTLGSPYDSDPGSILAINTTTGRIVQNMTSIMEPGGLALDTTDNLLFVGGIYDGTGIQVFDIADQKALTIIPANGSFTDAVFNPSNGDAYFLDGYDDRVVVVNCASQTVTGSISTKYSPVQGSFDPVNDEVYVVGNFYSSNQNLSSQVLGINATGSLVANVTMAPTPETMFINSHSGLVYFIGYYLDLKNNISAIDPTTDRIVQTFNTSQFITTASFDPDNQQGYLIGNSESVIMLGPQKPAISAIFPLFAAPEAEAYDGKDRTMDVYSVLDGSNVSLVSVLDGEKLTGSVSLGATTTAAAGEGALAVSSRTGLAYVSPGNGTIFIVNGTGAEIVGRMEVQPAPVSIVYDPADDTLFLLQSQTSRGTLIAVNLSSGTNVSIPLDFPPSAMTYDQDHDLLVLGGSDPDGLVLVSASNMKIIGAYPLGSAYPPTSLAYDPQDNLIYAEIAQEQTLLAVNGTGGQEVYYNQLLSSGLLYDDADGYVFALVPGGVEAVQASVDLTVGAEVFEGTPTCMALDPANGYIYFGDISLGTVGIVQPGPGIARSGNATVTEEATVTQTTTFLSTTTTSSGTTTATPIASTTTSTLVSGVTSTATAPQTGRQVLSSSYWLAALPVGIVMGFAIGYAVSANRKRTVS
jgi:hypothetical protein